MQKIVNHQVLMHLLTHDTDPAHRQPGQFMHDALAFRDTLGQPAAAHEQLVASVLTAHTPDARRVPSPRDPSAPTRSARAPSTSVRPELLICWARWPWPSASWRTPTAAGARRPTDVKAFMTLYGWADNSPTGPAIAHPCLHKTAGGVGTFTNPVTFATDVNELGWCRVIYVPYMKRYFIHEDECSECDSDWNSSHLYRFDMWAGGDANSRTSPEKKALRACESTWTRADSVTDPENPTIIVDPPVQLARDHRTDLLGARPGAGRPSP